MIAPRNTDLTFHDDEGRKLKTTEDILAFLRDPANKIVCVLCHHTLNCNGLNWHPTMPGYNNFSHREPCDIEGCECGKEP